MSRDFISNFEEPEEPDNLRDDDGALFGDAKEAVEYERGEYPLNVCFVWPEGNRRFIEYSRLDGAEINAEHTRIDLHFSTGSVALIGIRLLSLFTSFIQHSRKLVFVDDARYNELVEDDPIINEVIFA